jgi:Protein of unknown function (DUF4230)
MADEPRRKSSLAWKIATVVAAGAVLVLVTMGVASLVPNLNPFSTKEVDRSGPVLLQSVRDLSQYHAAVGEFQVVIDLEKDVKFVPSFLAGSRALFVAAGSVNAFVDFSGMSSDALKVGADGKTVEVRLPEPQLDKPNLDQQRSYLFAQQRGIWDRFKSLFEVPDQKQFYTMGEQKIAEAAKSAGLLERAKTNTRTMLSGMLQSLGFQVSFPVDTKP